MDNSSEYWTRFMRNRVGRRRFLQVAGGTAAALAAAGLVGCGDDDDTSGGTPTNGASGGATTAAATATPQSIAVSPKLTIRAYANPVDFKPHGNQRNPLNGSFIQQICGQGLIKWDTDLQLKGYFSDMPTVSADGLTYTFKLIEGLKFSNGNPLNASAVIANYEHILDPTVQSPGAIAFPAGLTFDKPDETTVVCKLTEPFAAFPSNVGFRQYLTDMSAYNEQEPIGAGPFILEDWVPNEKVVFRKNPTYFDADRIYFDQLEEIISSDDDAALNALRSGEWYLGKISRDRIEEFRNSDELELIEVASNNTTLCICLKVDAPPFNDPRLREAIDLAMNRDDIIRVVYSGHGVAGAGWLTQEDAYYSAEADAWEHDPDRSRQLITEGGYDGLTVDLYCATGSGTQPDDAFNTYIKQTLEDVGLSINLIPKEEAALIADNLFPKNFTAITRYTTGKPELDSLSGHVGWWTTTGGTNFTLMSEPELDSLVAQARTISDFDQRKELFDQVQLIARQNRSYIMTGMQQLTMANRPEYKGFRLHPAEWIHYFEDTYIES